VLISTSKQGNLGQELQLTTTPCNTLQHTATHCNTLQHTATHCNTLQHTATLMRSFHLQNRGIQGKRYGAYKRQRLRYSHVFSFLLALSPSGFLFLSLILSSLAPEFPLPIPPSFTHAFSPTLSLPLPSISFSNSASRYLALTLSRSLSCAPMLSLAQPLRCVQFKPSKSWCLRISWLVSNVTGR